MNPVNLARAVLGNGFVKAAIDRQLLNFAAWSGGALVTAGIVQGVDLTKWEGSVYYLGTVALTAAPVIVGYLDNVGVKQKIAQAAADPANPVAQAALRK